MAEREQFCHPATDGYLRRNHAAIKQPHAVDFQSFSGGGGAIRRGDLRCPSVQDRSLAFSIARYGEEHGRGH